MSSHKWCCYIFFCCCCHGSYKEIITLPMLFVFFIAASICHSCGMPGNGECHPHLHFCSTLPKWVETAGHYTLVWDIGHPAMLHNSACRWNRAFMWKKGLLHCTSMWKMQAMRMAQRIPSRHSAAMSWSSQSCRPTLNAARKGVHAICTHTHTHTHIHILKQILDIAVTGNFFPFLGFAGGYHSNRYYSKIITGNSDPCWVPCWVHGTTQTFIFLLDDSTFYSASN